MGAINFNSIPSNDGVIRVYILTQDDSVVYVGVTKNLSNRIRAHHQKIFNGISFFKAGLNPNKREVDLIVKHKPKFNMSIPKNDRYIVKSEFIKLMIEKLNIESSFSSSTGKEYFDSSYIDSLINKGK